MEYVKASCEHKTKDLDYTKVTDIYESKLKLPFSFVCFLKLISGCTFGGVL